jgi:hypothetical protein
MTIINSKMESLQDKDVFLVKIPNKLKDLLRQPETFTLTAESENIGVIEQIVSASDPNPENNELDALQGKRKGFRAKCKLDVPIKR